MTQIEPYEVLYVSVYIKHMNQFVLFLIKVQTIIFSFSFSFSSSCSISTSISISFAIAMLYREHSIANGIAIAYCVLVAQSGN